MALSYNKEGKMSLDQSQLSDFELECLEAILPPGCRESDWHARAKALANCMMKAAEIHSKIKDEEHIDLQIEYTADEYGEESKKLGIIKYAYDGDAGLDLPTVLKKDEQIHGLTVFPSDRIMLHTGLKIAFPRGYWGRIIHRSSTERRHRLRVIEGVIDAYRGEILVQVHNGNSFPIIIQHGQKLGQLIIGKVHMSIPRVVDQLPPSERGANGFGSSGA